jgi:hypothetical protein
LCLGGCFSNTTQISTFNLIHPVSYALL